MDLSEEGECSSNVDDIGAAGPIRKRRFSNARIQPTRIKKVMQSDEDIGRMVASVPVAVGSAMEHFAEKILEAAARCVPYSSSRTLSPMHIKYAIMQNPHFAFLEPLTKDIKLPKFSAADSVDAQGSSASILMPPLLQCRQIGETTSSLDSVKTNFGLSSSTNLLNNGPLSAPIRPVSSKPHVSFDLSSLSSTNITSTMSSPQCSVTTLREVMKKF